MEPLDLKNARWPEDYPRHIRELRALAEEDYRRFQEKLIPGERILGVRMPVLRRMAREIGRGDYAGYLAAASGGFHETLLLRGLVIGTIRDVEQAMAAVQDFVPEIRNWAVCDSFCGGLKITHKYSDRIFRLVEFCCAANQEFTARFGAVMLLMYYVNDDMIGRTLELLAGLGQNGYYARMAVAWALSVCYVKYPGHTAEYLKHKIADRWILGKTLQKIRESYRVSDADKREITRLCAAEPGEE